MGLMDVKRCSKFHRFRGRMIDEIFFVLSEFLKFCEADIGKKQTLKGT